MEGKQHWVYNFTDGGWNSEWASSREEAIRMARQRWAGSRFGVDEATFNPCTEEAYTQLLALFW